MGRFAAGNAPEIDRLVADAVAGVASAIAALSVPRLAGVVLGGGYGRGEGGVLSRPGADDRLSNDLDFYVVTEAGASEADIDRIGRMLKPVSDEWTARLGVDADFCRAKTPWRLKHDERRLMVQELLRGYCDVFGRKGEELFAGISRLEPSALPWTEAVRLLVNRGAGLLLAAAEQACPAQEPGGSQDFIARNINKCVLGAGDARLIASGRYRWRIEERAAELGDAMYSRAAEWKLRPSPSPICDWEAARAAWLDAQREICGDRARRPRRTIYSAVRWVARRRTIGPLRTFGLDPEVRMLRSMRGVLEARLPFPPALKKDWAVFN